MAHRHETQAYPEPVQRLIDELARLPGIGQRSAERMAFYLLKSPSEDALKLAQAITDVKQRVGHCRICYNLSDTDPCTICSNPRRDASTVLVVEQPKDLISLEQTGMFQGVYHVLVGRIDPLADVHPESLTVADLLRRVDEPKHNARGEKITEVILGMNPISRATPPRSTSPKRSTVGTSRSPNLPAASPPARNWNMPPRPCWPRPSRDA
jgi:recombination protein RecR